MENVSPIENGARKQRRRRRRQQQRRRHSHEDFRSAMMVSPTKDMERQYKEYGLPSAPKHPINRKTMPLDKVLKQVKDGSFGEEVREICYGQEEDDEIDMESIRRVLFLGGRDFGDGVPRLRNGRMAELVGLEEDFEPEAYRRFEDVLSGRNDQDLINEVIGAEKNDRYTNHGEATGKTYQKLYGEQVLCILRYIRQTGAFGFLSDEDMEKLVYFFRFQFHGTCYLTNICVIISYYGQTAVDFDSVLYPLDVGQLIRAFKDDDLYDYIMHDNGGDSIDRFKEILERLGFGKHCLEINTNNAFERESYDLKEVLKSGGPGIVCNFECTDAFHAAYKANPAWQSNRSASDAFIGIPRFDMQEGQKFEDVQAEWMELDAPRGHGSNTDAEIQRLIKLAEEKTNERSSLSINSEQEEALETKTGKSRGGDGSVPMHWQQSPDGKKPSPRRDTVAVGPQDSDLDDQRQLDHGSDSTARYDNLPQIRDRPPAFEDEDADENPPTHAMICIGGRIDKNKKVFLLLQNSWARMPLVEVSIDYFIAAGATLTTVSRSEHSKFKKFAKADCLYAASKTFVADCSRNKN